MSLPLIRLSMRWRGGCVPPPSRRPAAVTSVRGSLGSIGEDIIAGLVTLSSRNTSFYPHHNCRNCAFSYCYTHCNRFFRIRRLGFSDPVRVCSRCAIVIQAEEYKDRLLWRWCRVKSFLKGSLIPYKTNSTDRRVDKIKRCVDGAIYIAKITPFSASLGFVARSVEWIMQYGSSGLAGVLLRNDFVLAMESLRKIAGLENPANVMTLKDMSATIYYMLAINRGERGNDPDVEEASHEGMGEVEEEEIDEILQYAPFCCEIVYQEDHIQAQLLARHLGYDLLFVSPPSKPEEPAFMVFVSEVRMEVLIAIRGTRSVEDLVTDIRSIPIPFPPEFISPFPEIDPSYQLLSNLQEEARRVDAREEERYKQEAGSEEYEIIEEEVDGITFLTFQEEVDESSVHKKVRYEMSGKIVDEEEEGDEGEEMDSSSHSSNSAEISENGSDASTAILNEWLAVNMKSNFACGGMAKSATYLYRELSPCLHHFVEKGFNIRLCGHSLGGSVAALLTILLSMDHKEEEASRDERDPLIKCFSFSSPCCIDEETSKQFSHMIKTIILHDDVIPRISPVAIRYILQDLFKQKGTLVSNYLDADWRAIMKRAKNLWEPRWRNKLSYRIDQLKNNPTQNDLHEQESGKNERKKSTDDMVDVEDFNFDDIEVIEDEKLVGLFLPGEVFHIYRFSFSYSCHLDFILIEY